ncbi:hypothetical protein BCR35DRAFT_311521 [Leucosporidium creatinivorum]|uniref:Mitochondrial protein n=1 Tax=Leucosporidium creatinivorum TaxID=106004 RepID=A0A1Y2BW14_9BASI|nr:hypothetical protein BCR35DRAFT_311521 [Leucosporidium creatinivorum]
MPKLSSSLKALIAAPHAHGNALPAPPLALTNALFNELEGSASSKGVGKAAWLTLSTSALVTLNSPETLGRLYDFAKGEKKEEQVQCALLMREAGLKCISFSGIPRAINSLNHLQSTFPPSVVSSLPTTPTRHLTPSNIANVTTSLAPSLWTSIYASISPKLLSKLALSHPDLPVHILESHYGALLSNPSDGPPNPVGRVLTSVVAVACLRAQGGVGPQVMSHVLGLMRGMDGKKEGETVEVEGEAWLASEEGAEWVLGMVDRIVESVANGERSFGAVKAKL